MPLLIASKQLPYLVKGSALAKFILDILGWKVNFSGFPSLQGVIVIYPHTSNFDFVVLILVKWYLGISGCFFAKDSLFKIPILSSWMKWVGGIPVNRNSPHGLVSMMGENFKRAQKAERFLWLALTPEGTRKWTPGWKTGFYKIAINSGSPVGFVSLDYSSKVCQMLGFFNLTGDVNSDMTDIANLYINVKGFHPYEASPIVPIIRPGQD